MTSFQLSISITSVRKRQVGPSLQAMWNGLPSLPQCKMVGSNVSVYSQKKVRGFGNSDDLDFKQLCIGHGGLELP